MEAAITIATLVLGGILALALGVFIRALSVRLMTGKWPHQDEEAKKLFDSLP